MEPAKPRPVTQEVPSPVADPVRDAVRVAVEEALSPARAWRREAEARLDRLELELAVLRMSTRTRGE